MEILTNGYLKIQPVAHDSFITTEKDSYEEIGVVLAKDETCPIPVGSKVKFDSFMAKKYPLEGQEGKYEWYVHFGEIVSYATDEISKK